MAPDYAFYDPHGSCVTHLECGATGTRLPKNTLQNLSPAGKPILVRYDLPLVSSRMTCDALQERPRDLWRYRELLPVEQSEHIVSLGEDMTPLVMLPAAARAAQGGWLAVKDEGRLPTGSFKARGLTMAVAMARGLGVRDMVMPSNGNAGAALAAYCARAGMTATVFCPVDTPRIKLEETELHGARVHRIDGYIDDCGRLAAEHAQATGAFNVSTLREPYRIEGKKTMGLELAEQMGWHLPDVIFYPTGGGTGLIGMWKAFQELEAIGFIRGRKPRMVAVQAEGCAPIVRAFEAGAEHAERWADAHTIAAGIRVPSAIGDFLILRAVRESGGFAIAVADTDILEARQWIAAGDGFLMCPEGAATYVAYERALAAGLVSRNERAVLFNCAIGQKYPLAA
ncbi:MAG: threonine synthase [Alphaproteobacteria bacterium]